MNKYLSEFLSGDLACFYITVWHEMSVRSVGAGPAESQALFFSRPWLYENISLTRNFRINPSTKRLL